MVSDFELSAGVGISTEKGEGVVVASGEVVKESNKVINIPGRSARRTSSKSKPRTVTTAQKEPLQQAQEEKEKVVQEQQQSKQNNNLSPYEQYAQKIRTEQAQNFNASSKPKEITITVDPDKKDVAEKVVADLNASNKRTQEKLLSDKEKQESFNKALISNIRSGNVLNPTLSSFGANVIANKQAETDLMSSEYNNIQKVSNYGGLSGANPGYEFYKSSRSGKQFLLNNSPEINEVLGTQEAKDLFLETDDSLKRKGFIKRGKANREIINAYYEEKGVVGRTTYLQRLTNNISPNALYPNTVLTNDPIREKDLIDEAFKGVTTKVWSDVKEGGQAIGSGTIVSIDVANPDLPIGRGGDLSISLFPKGKPSASALAGAGMIAYSGATLITNQLGPIGKIGTEIVDVALALPDYGRAIINPTPYNKAVAKLEVFDVAVDLIPGFGTPNVNVNENVNFNIQETSRVGLQRNANNQVKGETGLQASVFGSPEINTPTSNAYIEVNAQADLFGEVNNNWNNNLNLPEIDLNANINRNRNVNVNKDVFSNENNNINNNINLNEEININKNVEENININDNVNINSNVNANLNANVNANLNADFNFNFNANTITPRLGRDKGGTEKGFQAFAKVRGQRVNIGNVTSREKAFSRGYSFVDNTSARTFGVSKQGSKKGLDFNDPKGFKKKKGISGFVFIEPSSKAINTIGELKGITYNKKNKIKGFGL